MGEPFRQDGVDNAAAWFAKADRNADGRLSRAEFAADATRFFLVLDVDRDGEIGPDEITRYETDLVPEVRVGMGGDLGGGGRKSGRGGPPGGGGGSHRGGGDGGFSGGRSGGGGPGGGGMDGGDMGGGGMGNGPPDGGGSGGGPQGGGRQGAARFGYLDLPEPVIAADADMNRGISAMEFQQAAARRFILLDTNGDGVIDAAELPHRGGGGGGNGGGPGGRRGGGPPPGDRGNP